ncbi:uncharacterized protein LOC107824698 isoform X2 [Nicotiana tabacum]|uniref:Uncharacterized protein LOC107824698 isoform X2 n=1 Tax=Nicotiana tabacum TaxID=4097 RepID=A0AC58U005_TOBAC
MLIHQRIVRQILLVVYFLLSYHGVQGEIKFSKLEERVLEKQLKLLNKPTVKTIKLAIFRTPNDPNSKYAGAGMSAGLWNPRVESHQHNALHKLVDPTLYGDTKTRLFTHFQAGSKHCFNTLCPGFVASIHYALALYNKH